MIGLSTEKGFRLVMFRTGSGFVPTLGHSQDQGDRKKNHNTHVNGFYSVIYRFPEQS
jgi:hypothetical protein